MGNEIESVSGSPDMRTGGVAHTGVPNFIYRWTEREVLKTVRTAQPAYEPDVQFFYNLILPHERFEKTDRPLLRFMLKAANPIARIIGRLFPRQSNEFGFFDQEIEKATPLARTGRARDPTKPHLRSPYRHHQSTSFARRATLAAILERIDSAQPSNGTGGGYDWTKHAEEPAHSS